MLTETHKCPLELAEFGRSHQNGKAKHQPQSEPSRMRNPSSPSSQEMKNSPLRGCVCTVQGSSKEVTKKDKQIEKKGNRVSLFPMEHRKLGRVTALGCSTVLQHPHAAPLGQPWRWDLCLCIGASSSEVSITQQEMQLQTLTLQHILLVRVP